MDANLAVHARDVVAALEAAGAAAIPPFLVGDAKVPDGGGWADTPGQSNFVGYVRFVGIDGGGWDGSMADPQEDPTVVYDATCFGATPGQARNIAHAVRVAVKGLLHTTVDGRYVDSVRFDFSGNNDLLSEVVKPTIHYTPVRFRITTR